MYNNIRIYIVMVTYSKQDNDAFSLEVASLLQDLKQFIYRETATACHQLRLSFSRS